MKITVPFSGPLLPDQYGDHIPTAQKIHGLNQTSFPFTVTDLPAGTVALAGTLIDYDTMPFVGFPWLHWVFTDVSVQGNQVSLPANASLTDPFPQGVNSLRSPFQLMRMPNWKLLKEHTSLETHYAGPRPNQGVHGYRLTVYALAAPTGLPQGFFQGDLMAQLDDKLLAVAGRTFTYAKEAQ